jgi:hypothetical protein
MLERNEKDVDALERELGCAEGDLDAFDGGVYRGR